MVDFIIEISVTIAVGITTVITVGIAQIIIDMVVTGAHAHAASHVRVAHMNVVAQTIATQIPQSSRHRLHPIQPPLKAIQIQTNFIGISFEFHYTNYCITSL